MELKVDRGTKILLALILLVLAAKLFRSTPPTPAQAQLNSGDVVQLENGPAGPLTMSLQTVDGNPLIIGLAAGEGDRVYFYDGGSLWASKDAGENWTKVR